MASRDVEQVASGVWCWETRPRGLRAGEFGSRTSYAVVVESELLLVDPLVAGDNDLVVGRLDNLVGDRVRILATSVVPNGCTSATAARRLGSMFMLLSPAGSATCLASRRSRVRPRALRAFTRSGGPWQRPKRARRIARAG